MNENSSVIVSLCSHLCADSCKPFTPYEWTKFAKMLMEKSLQPKDVINFSTEDFKHKLLYTDEEIQRVRSLFDRSGSLIFELEKFSSMGIKVVTRADSEYPKVLKSKLKENCPPLFYYAGDLNLTNRKYAGFVGSRTIDDNDTDFTKCTVSTIVKNGFGVVSGGAKGVDSTASLAALAEGCFCIEYLADSLARKIKKRDVVSQVQKGNLLLISIAKPDAGFNAGFAMQRNKFIYAQSKGTIVVKSDYDKGGTWSGATEALRNGYCPVFCRNNQKSLGNKKLIELGAIAIDENWDGNLDENEVRKVSPQEEQLSLFG
ncbi:MAG: DNA-processing protein DprA [Fibrobacter sp.]|nr:DNA-processing protein DprA [Fibrobacter sp.]